MRGKRRYRDTFLFGQGLISPIRSILLGIGPAELALRKSRSWGGLRRRLPSKTAAVRRDGRYLIPYNDTESCALVFGVGYRRHRRIAPRGVAKNPCKYRSKGCPHEFVRKSSEANMYVRRSLKPAIPLRSLKNFSLAPLGSIPGAGGGSLTQVTTVGVRVTKNL